MNIHTNPDLRVVLSELTKGMKNKKYMIEPTRIYTNDPEILIVAYRCLVEDRPMIQLVFEKKEPNEGIEYDHSKAYVYIRVDYGQKVSEDLLNSKLLWESGYSIDPKEVPELVEKYIREAAYMEKKASDDLKYVPRAFKHFSESDTLRPEPTIEEIMTKYMTKKGLIKA